MGGNKGKREKGRGRRRKINSKGKMEREAERIVGKLVCVQGRGVKRNRISRESVVYLKG